MQSVRVLPEEETRQKKKKKRYFTRSLYKVISFFEVGQLHKNNADHTLQHHLLK